MHVLGIIKVSNAEWNLIKTLTSMEQLYPQNIIERHYPVLREQRERKEREEEEASSQPEVDEIDFTFPRESVLHENEPLPGATIGSRLNTIA